MVCFSECVSSFCISPLRVSSEVMLCLIYLCEFLSKACLYKRMSWCFEYSKYSINIFLIRNWMWFLNCRIHWPRRDLWKSDLRFWFAKENLVSSIKSIPFCGDGLDFKFYGHPIYGIFAFLNCPWYFSNCVIFHIVVFLKGDCKLLEDAHRFISYFSKYTECFRGSDSAVEPGRIYCDPVHSVVI